MASRVALDFPCSNPGDERPCSLAQLWGEAFSSPGGSRPFLREAPSARR